MGSVIDLKQFQSADSLRRQLEALQVQLAELDAEEPADMMSEAYEAWGDAHENLEDQIDEILDQLDALEG